MKIWECFKKKSLKTWLLASFLHILKLKKYCKDSNTPDKMGFNKFTYPPISNSEQPTTDHLPLSPTSRTRQLPTTYPPTQWSATLPTRLFLKGLGIGIFLFNRTEIQLGKHKYLKYHMRLNFCLYNLPCKSMVDGSC